MKNILLVKGHFYVNINGKDFKFVDVKKVVAPDHFYYT